MRDGSNIGKGRYQEMGTISEGPVSRDGDNIGKGRYQEMGTSIMRRKEEGLVSKAGTSIKMILMQGIDIKINSSTNISRQE